VDFGGIVNYERRRRKDEWLGRGAIYVCIDFLAFLLVDPLCPTINIVNPSIYPTPYLTPFMSASDCCPIVGNDQPCPVPISEIDKGIT
jgi:hypothetical protein